MRTLFEKCKLSGKAKATNRALPAGIIPEPNAQPNARNNKKQPREELLEERWLLNALFYAGLGGGNDR